MKTDELFKIRPTGILIEDEKILIVKQKVNAEREWSLPGGKLERGETLDQAVIREIEEETGLIVKIDKLIYVCEKVDKITPLIHITFLLKRVEGNITLPSNEHETTPIYDVKMVEIKNLMEYGFSEKFKNIVQRGFPDAGSYMGTKSNIGL